MLLFFLLLGILGALILYAPRRTPLLFGLRALALGFTLALALPTPLPWNPPQNPRAVALLDLSRSMRWSGKDLWAAQTAQALRKLGLPVLAFGSRVRPADTLDFRDPETDLPGALEQVKAEAIFLLSDGYSTVPLPQGLVPLVPVYPLLPSGLHYPPDLAIEALSGTRVLKEGSSGFLQAKLLLRGLPRAQATLRLKENGRVLAEQTLPLKEGEPAWVSFPLRADSVGRYTYQIEATGPGNDQIPENNRAYFSLRVIEGRKNILLLASHPSPEIRFLRGVPGPFTLLPWVRIAPGRWAFYGEDHVNFAPSPRLGHPQGIVLFDPDPQILRLTDSLPGGRLVLLGPRHLEVTGLLGLPGRPQLRQGEFPAVTEEALKEDRPLGALSGVLLLPSLPPSTPLLRTPTLKVMGQKEGYPVLLRLSGKDRPWYLGLGIGFWRLGLFNRAAYDTVFGHVLRELTRGQPLYLAEPLKTPVLEGEGIRLTASAYTDVGDPIGDLLVIAWDERDTLPLPMESPGHYLSPPLYRKAGTYRFQVLFLKESDTVAVRTVSVEVRPGDPESFAVGVNRELLRRLAALSGGKVLKSPEEAAQVLRNLQADRSDRRVLMVDLAWLPFVIVFLLGLEWWERKRRGLP